MREFGRLLAFVAGGLLGGILVVLLLRAIRPPAGLSIDWHAFGLSGPPTAIALTAFALALSAALGGVAWLGFEAGRACSERFPRLGEAEGRFAILAGSLVLNILLGVLLGVLSNLPNSNNAFLPAGYALLAFLPSVPLAHGLLTGCTERPIAAIIGGKALLYGPLAGLFFGLSTSFVYVATFRPQPCLGCRFSFPPEYVAGILALMLIGIGVGLGIVTACAESGGLLLRSPLRQPARRNV